MSKEPLDLLGRKLQVGDHVVWQMGRGLGHGFVTDIMPYDKLVYRGKSPAEHKYETDFRVTATKAPGSSKRGQTANALHFCAIVLPDIQDVAKQLGTDPEVQLAGPVPEVSALEGSA